MGGVRWLYKRYTVGLVHVPFLPLTCCWSPVTTVKEWFLQNGDPFAVVLCCPCCSWHCRVVCPQVFALALKLCKNPEPSIFLPWLLQSSGGFVLLLDQLPLLWWLHSPSAVVMKVRLKSILSEISRTGTEIRSLCTESHTSCVKPLAIPPSDSLPPMLLIWTIKEYACGLE